MEPLLIKKIKTLQALEGYKRKEEFLIPIIETAINDLIKKHKLEETFKQME